METKELDNFEENKSEQIANLHAADDFVLSPEEMRDLAEKLKKTKKDSEKKDSEALERAEEELGGVYEDDEPKEDEQQRSDREIFSIVGGETKEVVIENAGEIGGEKVYKVETTMDSSSAEDNINAIALKMVLQKTPDDFDSACNSYRVNDLEINLDGRQLTLHDLGLKGGLELRITAAPERSPIIVMDHAKKPGIIFVPTLSSTRDLASILHEVGHFEDFIKRPSDAQECYLSAYSPFLLGEKSVSDRALKQSKRERTAWANAMKAVRKLGIPMEGIVKEQTGECLDTYDAATKVLVKNAGVEHFATDGARINARAKLRNKGGVWGKIKNFFK